MEWRDVVGFEAYFKVSSCGQVFSKRSNKILKQWLRKNGYMTVAVRIGGRNGQSYCFKIHRLVAEAFIPNLENKPMVNHIDNNRSNNHISNIEWCTAKENAQHCVKSGNHPRLSGEDNGQAKLTKDQVEYIRKVFKPRDKEFGARALGRKFNVNKTTILSVVNNESWK
jgi:hypothetical protein